MFAILYQRKISFVLLEGRKYKDDDTTTSAVYFNFDIIKIKYSVPQTKIVYFRK